MKSKTASVRVTDQAIYDAKVDGVNVEGVVPTLMRRYHQWQIERFWSCEGTVIINLKGGGDHTATGQFLGTDYAAVYGFEIVGDMSQLEG